MALRKIAIIPARSGSKGLPNKNILMLLDKPLIAYTIEAAIKSEVFEQVIVSTDSLEYKKIAEEYGAKVIIRDEVLSSDTATSFMVIEDILNKVSGFDYFVLLQPTSPFRTELHINDAINLFEENNHSKFLVSVVESNKPSILINSLDEHSGMGNFSHDFSNYRRQNKKEYCPNGAIFIGYVDSYLERKHFFGNDSIAYIMDKKDSLDIDDLLDFELAIVIQTKKNKSKILYENIINRINDKKESFINKHPITLIGHSIFDYWNIDNIKDTSVNNLAIAGINSKEYYELILEKQLISELGDTVLLMSGTNDIVLDDWNVDFTIYWVNKIIEKLVKINPKVHIYFLGVPPVSGRIDRSNLTINKLNEKLEINFKHCNGISWIPFFSSFYDEFGALKRDFTNDGLHFSEKAYAQLEKEISGILS